MNETPRLRNKRIPTYASNVAVLLLRFTIVQCIWNLRFHFTILFTLLRPTRGHNLSPLTGIKIFRPLEPSSLAERSSRPRQCSFFVSQAFTVAHNCDFILQVRSSVPVPAAADRNRNLSISFGICDLISIRNCAAFYSPFRNRSGAAWESWFNVVRSFDAFTHSYLGIVFPPMRPPSGENLWHWRSLAPILLIESSGRSN